MNKDELKAFHARAYNSQSKRYKGKGIATVAKSVPKKPKTETKEVE